MSCVTNLAGSVSSTSVDICSRSPPNSYFTQSDGTQYSDQYYADSDLRRITATLNASRHNSRPFSRRHRSLPTTKTSHSAQGAAKVAFQV
jgi:hypothetical protein